MAFPGTRASGIRRLLCLTTRTVLVLCALVAGIAPVLLTASFWRHDRCALSVRRPHSAWLAQVVSSRGGLGIDINHWFELAPNPREPGLELSWTKEQGAVVYPDWASASTPRCNWYFAGFQLRVDDEYVGSTSVSMTIPEVALLVSILPLWWAGRRAFIQRQRRARGYCVQCGYDLRASSGCCPECGAVPREPPHNPPMQRTTTASSIAVE